MNSKLCRSAHHSPPARCGLTATDPLARGAYELLKELSRRFSVKGPGDRWVGWRSSGERLGRAIFELGLGRRLFGIIPLTLSAARIRRLVERSRPRHTKSDVIAAHLTSAVFGDVDAVLPWMLVGDATLQMSFWAGFVGLGLI